MEKIVKLILQIGFILTTHDFEDYIIYYYNSYKIYFYIETKTLSLSHKNKTDLIFFDINLDNKEEFDLVVNFLTSKFKYELRKQKIDNLLN